MFLHIAFLIAAFGCAALAQPYAVSGSYRGSSCGYESFLHGEIHRPGACIPVTGESYYMSYDCSDLSQLKQRTFSDTECADALSEWQNVTSTCAEGSSSTFTSKRCVPHVEWLSYMMIATVLYPNNASCQNDSNWIEASVTGPHCERNGQQSYSFGCSATHEIFYGCTDSQCSDCQGSATPLQSCRASETKAGKFTAQRCFLTPLPPMTATPKAAVPPTAKIAPAATPTAASMPTATLSPQQAPSSSGVNQPSEASTSRQSFSLLGFFALLTAICNLFM